MATEQDILTFFNGEDIVLELFAKDDDGDALASPGDEEVTLVVTRAGVAVLRVNGSPQVALTNAGAAHWTITLDAADDLDGVVQPGKGYRYEVWTENSLTEVTYLQAAGRLVYQKAAGPNAA